LASTALQILSEVSFYAASDPLSFQQCLHGFLKVQQQTTALMVIEMLGK